MASEYVHEIRLQNSLGHWCDVQVDMDIELPNILYVDSKLAPYPAFPGYFKLQARHCSPAPVTIRAAHQTTAMYCQYAIGFGELSICLNFLMYPHTAMPVLSGIGNWSPLISTGAMPISFPTPGYQTVAIPPGALAGLDRLTNKGADPWGRSIAEWNPEPECHCDMRTLMSVEHPAGCAWMVWKRAQRRATK